MNEIAKRLHENRQVELAKSILESQGYKVTKKMDESIESLPESHEERLGSMRGKRVQGIGDYGTELWNEFLELQGTDTRIEELVNELGFNWFDKETEEEPAEDEIMKVLLAYYKEKAR